jgi:hypothetical protein
MFIFQFEIGGGGFSQYYVRNSLFVYYHKFGAVVVGPMTSQEWDQYLAETCQDDQNQ